MFFEYERGQGGGRVKQVTLSDDRTAIVEFEEAKSVDVVLQKVPIKMLGETVDVKAFVPYLEPGESIDSMNVDGLPGALSKEIASMKLAVKRDLKVGDRVRVKSWVQKPRYNWGTGVSHEHVGNIDRFDTDEAGRRRVIVNFPSHRNWQGDPDEMEIVY